MKNTKPTTRKKKIVHVNPETYPSNEIADIHDRIDNLWKSLRLTDESIFVLAERQQVIFWGIAVATILGAVNFIWLCLK